MTDEGNNLMLDGILLAWLDTRNLILNRLSIPSDLELSGDYTDGNLDDLAFLSALMGKAMTTAEYCFDVPEGEEALQKFIEKRIIRLCQVYRFHCGPLGKC